MAPIERALFGGKNSPAAKRRRLNAPLKIRGELQGTEQMQWKKNPHSERGQEKSGNFWRLGRLEKTRGGENQKKTHTIISRGAELEIPEMKDATCHLGTETISLESSFG